MRLGISVAKLAVRRKCDRRALVYLALATVAPVMASAAFTILGERFPGSPARRIL